MGLNDDSEIVVIRWEDFIDTDVTTTINFDDPIWYTPYIPEILEKDSLSNYRKKLVDQYGFR